MRGLASSALGLLSVVIGSIALMRLVTLQSPYDVDLSLGLHFLLFRLQIPWIAALLLSCLMMSHVKRFKFWLWGPVLLGAMLPFLTALWIILRF